MKKLPLSHLYLLAIALFSSSPIVFAQARKSSILTYDTAAHPGKVTLTDGTQLRGRIIFNDNDAIVTVYTGEENESHSFTSRKIVNFQFYSPEVGRERIFYSLEYENQDTNIKDTEFFEILKELNSFIVLVRIERVKTEARKNLLQPQQSPLIVDRYSKKITQTQIVYFMDAAGQLEPYLKILEKEIGGDVLDWNEKHNRFINADLFQKYTGEHFKALVEYAKQNNLSFKHKEHIVTILDYYQQLAGKL